MVARFGAGDDLTSVPAKAGAAAKVQSAQAAPARLTDGSPLEALQSTERFFTVPAARCGPDWIRSLKGDGYSGAWAPEARVSA